MGALLVVVTTSIISISLGRRLPKHPKDHPRRWTLPRSWQVPGPASGGMLRSRTAAIFWMFWVSPGSLCAAAKQPLHIPIVLPYPAQLLRGEWDHITNCRWWPIPRVAGAASSPSSCSMA
jgi:hypothetical protein